MNCYKCATTSFLRNALYVVSIFLIVLTASLFVQKNVSAVNANGQYGGPNAGYIPEGEHVLGGNGITWDTDNRWPNGCNSGSSWWSGVSGAANNWCNYLDRPGNTILHRGATRWCSFSGYPKNYTNGNDYNPWAPSGDPLGVFPVTGRYWLSTSNSRVYWQNDGSNFDGANNINARINMMGNHCTSLMVPAGQTSQCNNREFIVRRMSMNPDALVHCQALDGWNTYRMTGYLNNRARVLARIDEDGSDLIVNRPIDLEYLPTDDVGVKNTNTVALNLPGYNRNLQVDAQYSSANNKFYMLATNPSPPNYGRPAGINVRVSKSTMMGIRNDILNHPSFTPGNYRVRVRLEAKIIAWSDVGLPVFASCFAGPINEGDNPQNITQISKCASHYLDMTLTMNVQRPEVVVERVVGAGLTVDDVKDQNIRVQQPSSSYNVPNYAPSRVEDISPGNNGMKYKFTGLSLGGASIVASQHVGDSSPFPGNGKIPQQIRMNSRWCPGVPPSSGSGSCSTAWNGWTPWGQQSDGGLASLTHEIDGNGWWDVRVEYRSAYSCSIIITKTLSRYAEIDSGESITLAWGALNTTAATHRALLNGEEVDLSDTRVVSPVRSEVYKMVIQNKSTGEQVGYCDAEVVVRSKMPYLYIGGGDLYSGVALPKAVPSGGDPCDISDRGAIVTSGSSPDANKARLRGSSTAQYGVFAAGSISSESGARRTNFGGNHNYLRSGFNDLLFATNTSISGPERYGNFDATCVHEDDLYRSLGVNVAAVTEVSSSSALASILGDGSSSIRISGNWTAGGSVSTQERKVIIVEGNITLNGNIEYNGSYGLGGIPRITLISRGGDIRIGQSVSRIDANLIALPENEGMEGGGKIDTCYNITIYNQLTTLDCNQQLNLNGLVVAQRIAWKRTHGTLSGSIISPGGCQHSTAEYDKNCAAERAERHPATYLPQSGGSTVRSIPITTRELPPVY